MAENHNAILAQYGLRVKVREYRRARQMTLQGLASLVDMTFTRLGEKERGLYPWRLLDLIKIAQALDVPFWQLVEVGEHLLAPEHLQQLPQGHGSLVLVAHARKQRAAAQETQARAITARDHAAQLQAQAEATQEESELLMEDRYAR